VGLRPTGPFLSSSFYRPTLLTPLVVAVITSSSLDEGLSMDNEVLVTEEHFLKYGIKGIS
jgi:hypothetical protein